MIVYVVVYMCSYDGPIFENVFGSHQAAEEWIVEQEGKPRKSDYEILEYEVAPH